MAKPESVMLTYAHGRHALGYDQLGVQIWRRTRWRQRQIAQYSPTNQGYQDAVDYFRTLEPEAAGPLATPQTFQPRRLTPEAWAVTIVGTAMVVTAATVGGLVLSQGQQRHARGIPAALSSPGPTSSVATSPTPVDGSAPAASDSAGDSTANNTQRGWVYQSSQEAMFIEWTRTGSTVVGSLTDADLATPTPHTVNTIDDAFTGVINQAAITLSFPQGLGSVTNIAARIANNNLIVSFPQPNGTLAPVTFIPGTAADYNRAAAALQSEASSNEASAQAAQSQAAQASASAAHQAELAQDIQNAASEIRTIQNDADFKDDLSAIAGDVAQTNSDLAKTRSDAKGGQGSDCYNVSEGVSYDATQDVEYDAQQNVEYDVSQNLVPDIKTERTNIQTVQQDLQQLQADGLAPPAGAALAISTANAATAQAVTKANSYIDQTNADVTTAYKIANGMATGPCTGDGPGTPPAPLQHIK